MVMITAQVLSVQKSIQKTQVTITKKLTENQVIIVIITIIIIDMEAAIKTMNQIQMNMKILKKTMIIKMQMKT